MGSKWELCGAIVDFLPIKFPHLIYPAFGHQHPLHQPPNHTNCQVLTRGAGRRGGLISRGRSSSLFPLKTRLKVPTSNTTSDSEQQTHRPSDQVRIEDTRGMAFGIFIFLYFGDIKVSSSCPVMSNLTSGLQVHLITVLELITSTAFDSVFRFLRNSRRYHKVV